MDSTPIKYEYDPEYNIIVGTVGSTVIARGTDKRTFILSPERLVQELNSAYEWGWDDREQKLVDDQNEILAKEQNRPSGSPHLRW